MLIDLTTEIEPLVFLYILECMMNVFIAPSSMDKPLATTGELITWKDIGVGMLGCFIVVLIILAVSFIIRYLTVKKKKTSGDILEKDTEETIATMIANSKIATKLCYFFECLALGILCLVKGKNSLMMSTNKKPTKRDVLVSVIGWISIFLLVAVVVLICLVV